MDNIDELIINILSEADTPISSSLISIKSDKNKLTILRHLKSLELQEYVKHVKTGWILISDKSEEKDIVKQERKDRIDIINFFVAHPYKNFRHVDFRDVINSFSVKFNSKEKMQIRPIYADEHLKDSHILEKIKEQIRTSKFAIFDITNWNPNVTLELGYAIGIKKKICYYY